MDQKSSRHVATVPITKTGGPQHTTRLVSPSWLPDGLPYQCFSVTYQAADYLAESQCRYGRHVTKCRMTREGYMTREGNAPSIGVLLPSCVVVEIGPLC